MKLENSEPFPALFYIHKTKKGVKNMEKISINQEERQYEINSIQPISQHVLRIVFADTAPEEFGDIRVYTAGGILCASLPGYSTVYRDEGQTVYLSDDGSVYVPPSDFGEILPMEPYVPTEEELLVAATTSKKAEISRECERIISRGVSVMLSDGTAGHFSLTEHDQINLFGKQVQLAAGAEQVEYHADSQPCQYYSAADMQTIIDAAMFHVSYHTTYCNSLNMWLASCQTAEEVQQIFYGADVPEEYQSEVVKAYLLKIMAMAEDDGNGASETE